MVKKKTERGFRYYEFKDRNDVNCTLQKSSLATEDAIWLGCNAPDPRVCIPGQGWQLVPMPEGYICNDRMHLTRKQVKKLLPILQKFVDEGEI